MQKPLSEFVGVVAKVQTMAGGGVRVSFDVPTTEAGAVLGLALLADAPGKLVRVTVAKEENPHAAGPQRPWDRKKQRDDGDEQ